MTNSNNQQAVAVKTRINAGRRGDEHKGRCGRDRLWDSPEETGYGGSHSKPCCRIWLRRRDPPKGV